MGGKSKKGTTHMNPMESYLSGKQNDGADESQDNNSDTDSSKKPLVEDSESGHKTGKLTFNKPAGFKIPDGVKDGEAFDAMATVRFENGKLVLAELDGAPVQDEKNEGDEDEDEPTEDETTPSEDGSEDDSSESPNSPAPTGSDQDDVGAEEPKDFLSAIEKKASKLKR